MKSSILWCVQSPKLAQIMWGHQVVAQISFSSSKFLCLNICHYSGILYQSFPVNMQIVNRKEWVKDQMSSNKLGVKKSSPSVMIKKDLDYQRERNWVLYQGKISFEKSRYYEEWKRNIFFSSKNKMSSKIDRPLNLV